MQEYVSRAVVLRTEHTGELDARVSLFTQKYGKLVAKARSAKRITSKLAGHLQPGNLVRARLVEKSGMHVVDALKESVLPLALSDLNFLDRLLPEAEPDQALWSAFEADDIAWKDILKILGWDPRGAACRHCGGTADLSFHIGDQEFFCIPCAYSFRLPPSEIIYVA